MKPISFTYPNGTTRAITFSYDDGREHDRRLAALFNKYGLKATFHLNSGYFGKPGYIRADEAAAIFEGHEIAGHTVTHPFLSQQPNEAVIKEVMDDRKALEDLAGYPVRGFSYPFGDFGPETPALLTASGIDYARTVFSTNSFMPPHDFMLWHPTCHDKNAASLLPEFARENRHKALKLFYIWGHSYEFEDDNRWDSFEELLRNLSGLGNVWFATNMEIMRYLKAIRNLAFSADGSMAVNPSAVKVHTADGRVF